MGLPEERKLFDAALDMPFGVGALLEEDNVAGTVTGWTDRIAFKDDRALRGSGSFRRDRSTSRISLRCIPRPWSMPARQCFLTERMIAQQDCLR